MNALNWTPIARIAWKDMRRIGALWVALVGFWLVWFVVASLTSIYAREFLAPKIDYALTAILTTAMVYGLSWAGITFAAEHDDKTYGQLRSLPVSARQVFYGKILFGVNSTLLLIVALTVICGVHALVLQRVGGQYTWSGVELGEVTGFGLSLLALLIPLGLTVGMFWSLRIKHPLQALGLAGASMVILPAACLVIGEWFVDKQHVNSKWQESYDVMSLSLLSCVVIGLYIVDRRLVTHWLPNYSHADLRHGPATFRSTLRAAQTGSSLGRLFWLHGQQSFWLAIGLAGIQLMLVWVSYFGGYYVVPAYLAPIGCGVLGITVFRYEHYEQRFRWLAQLSVRPFEYWISRLLVPGVAAVVISGSMVWMTHHVLIAARRPAIELFQVDDGLFMWAVFSALLTVFSIGQFCAIWLSSVVISIAVTLIATCVAITWIGICTMLLIPPWLSCLPVVVLPLAASYLRVSRWFRETGSWKQWIIPSVPLALLVVGLPVATAFYRVYEIPGVELPPEMLVEPAPPTAAELAGAAQLNAVFAQIQPFNAVLFKHEPRIKTWIEEDPSVADELVRAIEGTSVLPLEYDTVNARWEAPQAAGRTLLVRGWQETNAGNIAKAWNYYRAALQLASICEGPRSSPVGVFAGQSIEGRVYRDLVSWAMHEDNSWEMIESAALYIDDRRQSLPPWTDAIRAERRFYHEALSSLIASERFEAELPQSRWVRFVPWEVARAERLEDYVLARTFVRLKDAQHAGSDAVRYDSQMDPLWKMINRMCSNTLFNAGRVRVSVHEFVSWERDRRAVIYQLAAIAFHRRHGEYPHETTKLTIAGRSLPDDVYAPGKMVILGLEADDDMGPRLVSPRALTSETFSDNGGHLAHFLLPVFDGWDPQRFEDRVASTAFHERSRAKREKLEAEQESASAQGGFSMPGAGGLSEPNAHELLELLPEVAAWTAMSSAVRSVLSQGSSEQRADLLTRFLDRPELALRFLPAVVALIDSPDVNVATHAANLFVSSVRANGMATSDTVEDYRCHLSTAPSGDLGAPVHNPENGHFYELIPGLMDWESAELSAVSRTFRGARGHLATVTSQAESEFIERLVRASTADAAVWLGGSDRGQEGVWRWMCGLETGKVFWRRSAETPSEFTNWLEGEPTSGGFLVLEIITSEGMHGGMGAARETLRGRTEVKSGWRSVHEASFGAANYALVEYELTNEPHPKTNDD